ncbi:MAG: hypothetical protein KDA25_00790 [Phycisphaerales bacterium]|nr:hypothetical protein [Phycisphaerales bacterium]
METEYRKWVHRAIAAALLAQGALAGVITQIEHSALNIGPVIWAIHGGVALVGAAVIIGYEKWLWRVLGRRIDYSGTWEFENQYASRGSRGITSPTERGSLNIEQTPFGIRFREATGSSCDDDREEHWRSTSTYLDGASGDIFASFECERTIHYPVQKERGRKYVGVERIIVTERCSAGRPRSMRGTFYGVCEADKKVEWGQTIYRRVEGDQP